MYVIKEVWYYQMRGLSVVQLDVLASRPEPRVAPLALFLLGVVLLNYYHNLKQRTVPFN